MKLREDFEVKCQAYDIISLVNDEYLKINNALKRENEKLIREITEFKSQQLKASKPFVDLTCDDDSDVEIIDEEKKKMPDAMKIPKLVDCSKTSEIIELEDDAPQPEESKKSSTPQFSMFDSLNMKYANESPWSYGDDIESLGKFIVDQI